MFKKQFENYISIVGSARSGEDPLIRSVYINERIICPGQIKCRETASSRSAGDEIALVGISTTLPYSAR